MWPDNIQAVNVFVSVGTQWRCGVAGPIGLDYGVLPGVLRILQVPRNDWPEVFDCIRILEDAALGAMRESKGVS